MKLCVILCGLFVLDVVSSSSMITMELKQVKGNSRNSLQRKAASRQLNWNIPVNIPAGDQYLLSDFGDFVYTGEVYIGGQYFNIMFDTGSSDLWVPNTQCTSPQCLLSTTNRYEHCSSTSYTANGTAITIAYGVGQVWGYTSSDLVQVGSGGPGMTCTFTEVIQEIDFDGSPFDGLMGMGLPALAASGATPYWLLASQQGFIPAPVFAFFLNINATSSSGGLLTLGGYNPAYVAPNANFVTASLITSPSINPGFWMFAMTNAQVTGSTASLCGSKSTGRATCNAIVDTGTSLIYGPSTQIVQINKLIGATVNPKQLWSPTPGFSYFPNCSYSSYSNNVNVYVGSLAMSITPFEYLYGPDQTGYCWSAFINSGQTASQFWILGDTFLNGYYTIFDYENQQLHFAPAASVSKRANEEENIKTKELRMAVEKEHAKNDPSDGPARVMMGKGQKPRFPSQSVRPAPTAARRALEDLLDELENNQ